MKPAISIVTPTFNRPGLLLRTIESVMVQSFHDWEMLVVDDGDGSGCALATAVGDARLRGLRNPGRGQVDARNHALVHASGQVIQLLDDDDRWEDPEYLLRVARSVGGTDGLCYRGGWLLQERAVNDVWVEEARHLFDPDVGADALRRDNLLLCSGVAYPRSLHALIGGFDPKMSHYWDWDWYLRVAAIRPLRRIGGPGVAISVRDTCASADRHSDHYRACLEVLAIKHGLQGLLSRNHLDLLAEVSA